MSSTPNEARFEVKFILDEQTVPSFLRWLRLHKNVFLTAYPDRWINNIYFDSLEFSAYEENLSGCSERTKLRVRWYGEIDGSKQATVELKQKRNCYGWKVRRPISWPGVENIDQWRSLKTLLREIEDTRISSAADFFSEPILINRYRRSYFVSRDSFIRVTIDTEQAFWDQRFSNRPCFGRKANNQRAAVVEVKFSREHRAMADAMLANIPLRASRHSKYMVGVGAL